MGGRFRSLPDGGTIACFKAGPFRVAYPDFLIGSVPSLTDDALAYRLEVAAQMRADLMRVQAPLALDKPGVVKIHRLGTVTIPSMAGWSDQMPVKARRALNRRLRSPLSVRKGRMDDGAALHLLYRRTMLRHGGSVRYTQRYFELIAPEAALVAELDGKLCGFVCVGFRGKRACYMHGAHDPEARLHYPSDQLFLEMLQRARDAGISSFDFLPSPRAQGGLNAYKKAWGGVDSALCVSDLALSPIRAHAFSFATRIAGYMASLRRA